ncbi:hypothetical protein ACH5Y9_07965 [Methylomonas sp. BW4-1]|uniref:hypothetical protein n=1 Tax=unclassified Methylomonas TaxID=2608980 RepID=UPI00051B945B|nr:MULTISPECIES: hypothetical protein [unclassified Methylomonas]PKD40683.1 hypothetical protein CWO84_09435 [Methylomonas sp. Kb3]QBC27615.1 hypothetical protein U737_12265 [Methylomonas sp. LW13]
MEKQQGNFAGACAGLNDVSLGEIIILEKFQEKYADKFTPGQLTWFMRNRARNGLSKSGAVILSARKFYINERLFTKWFASQKA